MVADHDFVKMKSLDTYSRVLPALQRDAAARTNAVPER